MANHITDLPGLDSNLEGTGEKDVILGLDGEDVLYGKAGNDVLQAVPLRSLATTSYSAAEATINLFLNQGTAPRKSRISKFPRVIDSISAGRPSTSAILRTRSTTTATAMAITFGKPRQTASPKPPYTLTAPVSRILRNLIGVTAKDLRHDVKDHAGHYDFG